jgi:hypothetical protein
MADNPNPDALLLGDLKLPPLSRQTWNLAQSLAGFVADGCKAVSEDDYRQRLEICDKCEYRHDNR